MPYFVGLDASKATTNICVMDAKGAIVREGKVETTPKAIVAFLRGDGRRYARVGMELWTLAPWLYQGLARAPANHLHRGLPIQQGAQGDAGEQNRSERRERHCRNDACGNLQNRAYQIGWEPDSARDPLRA